MLSVLSEFPLELGLTKNQKRRVFDVFPIKTGEQIVDLCQTNYSQPHRPKCSVVLNERFWPCSDLKQRQRTFAYRVNQLRKSVGEVELAETKVISKDSALKLAVLQGQLEKLQDDLLLMSKACGKEETLEEHEKDCGLCQSLKYASCTAPIGRFCSKHQLVHKEEKKACEVEKKND